VFCLLGTVDNLMSTVATMSMTTLSTRTLPSGEFVVDTLINGHITGTLLVDTGSSDVMINERFAKALGLPLQAPEQHHLVETGNGTINCPVFTLASLSIGNLSRHSVSVLVNDHAAGEGYDGLLGRSFFAGAPLMMLLNQ
jgi:clan AA aspartic protease (TIGR02281 family)